MPLFELTYQGADDAGPRKRRVDVQDLEVTAGDHLLLVGYCHTARAARHFRADRVRQAVDLETGEVFEDEEELTAHVAAKLGIFADDEPAPLPSAPHRRRRPPPVPGWWRQQVQMTRLQLLGRSFVGCSIVLLALVMLVVAAATMSDEGLDGESSYPEYAVGETFGVGHFSYKVEGSAWRDALQGLPVPRRATDSRYLVVDVAIRNDNSQARTIPAFLLIDGAGAEHEADSSATLFAEHALGLLDDLNPGVATRGLVVFDVPPDRSYKFRVQGGFWSAGAALVPLFPGEQ